MRNFREHIAPRQVLGPKKLNDSFHAGEYSSTDMQDSLVMPQVLINALRQQLANDAA